MLNIFKPLTIVGLELLPSQLKGAEVSNQRQHPFIHRLFALPLPLEDSPVKRIYMHSTQTATGIEGQDVLIRPLHLPLTKSKDIDAAFAFQSEPLLPYPAEQAILARQILNQTSEGSTLTILSVRKDLLEKHLESWHQIKIEPEFISCVQAALCQFGKGYVRTEKPFFILHLTEQLMMCVLIKAGKLLASYTHHEGLDLLYKAYEKAAIADPLSLNERDFNAHSEVGDAMKRLQLAIVKMQYALTKELKGEELAGVFITGEGVLFSHFEQEVAHKLQLPLLQCADSKDGFSSQEKQRYAVSIGLALGALLPASEQIDFRQQEFSYPHSWRRLRVPLATYFVLMFLLTISLYCFGQYYLIYQENKLKQAYVDLLATMNKSYEHFETAFLTKHPLAREKTQGEIVNAIELQPDDLLERLQFLQKDLQATPDSFPLFANIPRVSDVLAWLAQHPNVNQRDENGHQQLRLQIEHFSYVMLKRPVQGKKQEKYQVKVELEFSSPTPKWAREFHDALIAPNDLVDPKGEVKWSSNRGKYRTSFFLKDKTSYPNQ